MDTYDYLIVGTGLYGITLVASIAQSGDPATSRIIR